MSAQADIADDIGSDAPDVPEDVASNGAWSVLDKLSIRERRFVIRALRGQDLREAAEYAGSGGDDGAPKLLGRPRVKEALTTLAPLYIPIDPKRVARLLSAYWGEKLIGTAIGGSDAQATTAAKELVSLAGLGATSRVEHVHASLADVLGLLDRRASDERSLPPEPKRLELPAPATDTESDAPVTLDAIWDPVPSSPASKHGKAAPSPAPKSKPAKRGPARRRKTPPPSR
jgi:hypothetical protein